MRFLLSRGFALWLLLLRATCRVQTIDDPRPKLRRRGRRYVYAILHAHQLAALISSERGVGAMVSRSKDGEVIVPSLKVSGCVPVRGSSGQGKANRGGRTALANLIDHVKAGRPACLTVDGPRGPRGRTSKGIGELGRRAEAIVLPTCAIPRRRSIIGSAWDRLQIPWPLTRVQLTFGEPLEIRSGESLEQFRRRIEVALYELELRLDPSEARHSRPSQAAAPACEDFATAA